jgi:hypothetical protein
MEYLFVIGSHTVQALVVEGGRVLAKVVTTPGGVPLFAFGSSEKVPLFVLAVACPIGNPDASVVRAVSMVLAAMKLIELLLGTVGTMRGIFCTVLVARMDV